jgi:hypothetical protein
MGYYLVALMSLIGQQLHYWIVKGNQAAYDKLQSFDVDARLLRLNTPCTPKILTSARLPPTAREQKWVKALASEHIQQYGANVWQTSRNVRREHVLHHLPYICSSSGHNGSCK